MKQSTLKRKTPISRLPSKKQQELDKLWREITLLKWAKLGRRSQWTGQYIRNPSGHHIIRRSRGRLDTEENCYVCSWLEHDFIETHSVDVKKYPTKLLWEARDEK